MKNAKILVIGDENSAKISIKSKLEDLSYTVLAIESHGIKSVKNSGELKPDLILIDINQSGNYIETSKIRKYFNNPIIYLADYSDSQLLEKAELNPPVYIIRKQFSDIELKSTIETALYNDLKLKEGTKNLNAFLNAVNEPAFLIDLKGNILFTNEYTKKTLGKVVDSNIYELLPHHIAAYRKKYVENAIKAKKVTYFEDERYGKSYEYRIYPILDEKDEVSKLSVIGLDVTERKLVENTLKESEEKYRSIFENSTDAIFLTRPDGTILDVNPAAEEMYGYTKDELRKLGRSSIVDKEDPRLHASINERSITGKFKSEFNSLKKDGTKFLTDVTGKLFTDSNGNNKGIIIARDITERKKIENELKENQRTFETLVSNLPGVAYRCMNDPNWTMEFVSEGCLELTGYQPEDIIMNKNVSYEDLIHIDDRQLVWSTIQKALKENKPFKLIYRIITADLKEKYVWEQGRGIYSGEGKLIALEGFITDITKRKKAEKALQKSELYYRTIFENTGTATLIAGEDTVISLANTECEKLSGYSKEEIEGKKSWIDFVVEEDMQRLLNYHNIRENDPILAPKNYELKLQNKQGAIRDVHVTIELIPYTRNRVISLLDITDKKRSRKALRENEKKYRQLVENAHEGIWSVDAEGNTLFVNPRMADMLGYTVDEMLKMHLLSFMDKKNEKIVKSHVKNYNDIAEGLYEFKFIKKDGKKIHVNIDVTQVHDDHGNYIESLALISDITERRKAEEKLRLASKYNRSLIEASLDPLVTIGSDGKITDVNNSTELITGYAREQLIGTDFSDYFTEPEKARKGYQQVFQEGLVRDYPLKIKNNAGFTTPVLYNASVYKDELGNVIGVFAAARDITQLKKAEENIKASLEEKEILLREIHHRVKNNLQIISSLLSLQTGYTKDYETRNVLEESQNRVKSMAIVHEKLYSSENLVKIDFKDYIKDLTDSLFLTYKISPYMIKLNKNIDNIFLNVNTAIPCGLIINELVTNSLKHAFPVASGHGPANHRFADPANVVRRFEDKNREKCSFLGPKIGDFEGFSIPAGYVRGPTDEKSADPQTAGPNSNEIQIELNQLKNNLVLVVSDNGVGLPENIDFTNTESLGLRLVNNLVRQVDGTIELDKSEGTKFKITFKELKYKKRI
ncbi:PAS domain S-box protein [Methanobacterium sp.]|uniref:PAS domain S-box protein n=1 Tax=Methanobacterium sp. TaxID=2164 RepID=UPI00315948F2